MDLHAAWAGCGRSGAMQRYICIHCHFYQPPRENPWLEAVELQDSASPYHDWNERVTAECYLPNGAARILDGQARIAKIVNNYSRISFNFGPTLLSWMEQKAPQAYERILAADRQSQQLFSGHGSALAQAYNHIILPLANSRDRRSQILWGLGDFRQRFGRAPEGMWLPETAVDVETLELLTDAGIKFTVLAPHQARRMRNRVWEEWQSMEGGRIDPTRAYQCHLPSGRVINLFFYDGPISHAVAFESLLMDGERFAHRLLSGFNEQRQWPQLVHIATDGETYGHHFLHGDMALAYALDYLERNQLARITNYGEYLELHPATEEVEIVEKSSWSCLHGVARWTNDCGCRSGGGNGWNQQWRRPLRNALDWLRDDLSTVYEQLGASLFIDPWAARDDYIRVVLDRSPENKEAFFRQHALRPLSAVERVRALRLLEMQRHLMLMYTSCGWFFDELTGPATLQILQYAARALQLSQQITLEDREEAFLQRLQEAWSNVPGCGNGRHVFERFVKPTMLDLVGVAAHYAISSIFDGHYAHDSMFCYRVTLEKSQVLESGKTKFAAGVACFTSDTTDTSLRVAFGVLHFGNHNLSAGVRPLDDDPWFQEFLERACKAFSEADLPACLRLIDRYFNGSTYSLRSLFQDERNKIVSRIVESTLHDAEALYRRVYEDHAPLMCFLEELQLPLPPILRFTSEFVLATAVCRALADETTELDKVRSLLESMRRSGFSLDASNLESALRQRLNGLVDRWMRNPGDLGTLSEVEDVIALSRIQPFELNLWKSQNAYYELSRAIAGNGHGIVNEPWLSHFRGLAQWLGIALPQLPAPPHTEENHAA
jgi:alpha-amylase/alpha-mannosidase (GH57 family)